MADGQSDGKRSWPSPAGSTPAGSTVEEAAGEAGQVILADGAGASSEPGGPAPATAVRGKRNV